LIFPQGHILDISSIGDTLLATNAIDPAVELVGRTLRTVVIALLEAGRVSLPVHASERMDERHLTGPQIESALRSGALGQREPRGWHVALPRDPARRGRDLRVRYR
jgi:hypothetical protein